MNDRFGAHKTFKTGVKWAPTDYKPIDQTPYLEYIEKIRKLEKEQGENNEDCT